VTLPYWYWTNGDAPPDAEAASEPMATARKPWPRKRRPSQTPAEWIGEIEQKTEGRWNLGWVVELYHRCRYADEAPTPEEEHRVRELIRELR
jgi:hypothetical protein